MSYHPVAEAIDEDNYLVSPALGSVTLLVDGQDVVRPQITRVLASANAVSMTWGNFISLGEGTRCATPDVVLDVTLHTRPPRQLPYAVERWVDAAMARLIVQRSQDLLSQTERHHSGKLGRACPRVTTSAQQPIVNDKLTPSVPG
jgi:hypothetical protein